MKIVAKNIENSNVVAVFAPGSTALPDSARFMSLFTEAELKGSNFVDDPAMRVKVFEMPAVRFKYIFENNRVRIEESDYRYPAESRAAAESRRVIDSLYDGRTPAAYGFNYDVMYRFDAVIPQRDIMASFVDAAQVDEVRDFGWQFSLAKEKGKRIETYFFKAVSPLELRVHSNFHFNDADFPKKDEFQALFERCYSEMDTIMASVAF